MQVVSTITHGKLLESVDRLTDTDILHFYDTFTHEDLLELLHNKGTPKYIITDHLSHAEFSGLQIYCLPLFAANQIEEIKPFNNNNYETTVIFNFLVNKKQINRFLCLKFVEFFKLKNYDYTHSGFNSSFDMTDVINELNLLGKDAPLSDQDRGFVLSPTTIEPKYFIMPNVSESHNKLNAGVRLGVTTSCGELWNMVEPIISHSAISLITESNWGQRSATFTEKTIFSTLGLTLPIWIGGWKQANEWNRLGFDVFDDIIDHDYQYKETQIERCYYAFADNLDLLTNFEKTASLRQELMPRLKHNRELMLNYQLINYCRTEITKWPADLQANISNITQHFMKIADFF